MSGDNGQDQIQMFFPTVIQVSQIDEAGELNGRLLEAIYEIKGSEPNTKPDSWSCELYTTIGSAHHLLEYPEFRRFGEIAYEKTLAFANALSFDTANHRPRINECWVNVYGRSHSQEIHVHQNSVLSGIYYVKAPPGSAPTLFHSPLADVMLEPPMTQRNRLNNAIVGMEPVDGRMVLFRSCLRHSVKASAIDEDRVTIAFNVTM